MMDPLSGSNGLVAIAAYAIECSRTLCETLENKKSYDNATRELQGETKLLTDVLVTLQETLTASSADFLFLEVPLRSCGRLCSECSTLVTKTTPQTIAGELGVHQTLSTSYKGGNLTDFRSLISVYRSTVTIALADMNL